MKIDKKGANLMTKKPRCIAITTPGHADISQSDLVSCLHCAVDLRGTTKQNKI